MKEENSVYVKLEYEEALQSKKDILESQANLLRITQMIRRYRLLRFEELKLKAKMYRSLKDLMTNLKKIKMNMPAVKVPSIKREEEKTVMDRIKETTTNDYDDELELQLREIQKKLKAIGG